MKDKNEFANQIRQCEKAMYSLACSVVGNEADACDAVGEAILRAFKRMDTLKNDRLFKPWILRIVHNTAVDMIRKNSAYIDVSEAEDIPDNSAFKDISAGMVLRDAVESLKQPYRTVITLYYYEDISVKEIAKITGSTLMAVRQQLSRARNRLREILDMEDFING